ncbi:MAG: methyltransferase domain-containing protein [Magnetococcales bacterium]|nr:methyltransferase domain-containing protein [Magnetococcales bacterium]
MDFDLARTNMVKSQLAPNRVRDPNLLGSLMEVPREAFVAVGQQDFAYSDMALPLSQESSRKLLKPLQAAWMIEALEIKAGDRVLVAGAGRGYEVALLANMGVKVYALEADAALADKGKELASGEDVQWHVGDPEEGLPDEAPFDAILYCGALSAMPGKAVGQLGLSGRLVVVIGTPGSPLMRAMRVRGISGGDRAEPLFETVVHPLVEASKAAFVL